MIRVFALSGAAGATFYLVMASSPSDSWKHALAPATGLAVTGVVFVTMLVVQAFVEFWGT